MDFFFPFFQSLFENINLLKCQSYICNTSCIEISTLLATFNCKELGNVKVIQQLIEYLKERMMVNGKSFQV